MKKQRMTDYLGWLWNHIVKNTEAVVEKQGEELSKGQITGGQTSKQEKYTKEKGQVSEAKNLEP